LKESSFRSELNYLIKLLGEVTQEKNNLLEKLEKTKLSEDSELSHDSKSTLASSETMAQMTASSQGRRESLRNTDIYSF